MPRRIVGIEPILVDVPLREPVHGVHGVTSVQRSVLVRVTSDDGVEGWGNVDPTPGYSAMSAAEVHDTVRRIGPALTGADPFNVRRALAVMDREALGRYEAIAVVEMALVDLKARALGLPVHSLLGGRVKDEVAFNAWIGTVPPEQAAREATAWLGRGFRSAKIKVSVPSAPGVARVRVWAIMSRGRRPRGGRPPPEWVNVGYPPMRSSGMGPCTSPAPLRRLARSPLFPREGRARTPVGILVSRRFDRWVCANVGLAAVARPLDRWRPHPSNPLMRRRALTPSPLTSADRRLMEPRETRGATTQQ